MEKLVNFPGPKATSIIAKDIKYLSPSYTRDFPIVIDRGEGMWIYDPDGNKFLDFTAGIAVLTTGHAHPEIVKAISEQAAKFLHMSGTDFYYSLQSDVAEQLALGAPGKSPKKVFFTNSGAESVEAAMKLGRYKTRKTKMLAFIGSFHGRTMGALSLTCSKSVHKKNFAPFIPEVVHVPYAYCYRCSFNLEYPKCKMACVNYIKDVILQKLAPAEDVAFLIAEPIQGEGGYVVPPPEFHPELKKLCEDNGILYISDEVQSGMGRTGKMFAIEHFNVEPDIICAAKGIASGLPLGAIIAKEDVMTWKYGSHASTFGGNPVSCASALKTIEMLKASLMQNAATVGDYMISRLKEMQKTYACIGDVRGKGLMIGIEIVKDTDTKDPDAQLRNKIIEKAVYRGLLLLGCGPNSIRFCPPLIVTKDDADKCLDILEEILKKDI